MHCKFIQENSWIGSSVSVCHLESPPVLTAALPSIAAAPTHIAWWRSTCRLVVDLAVNLHCCRRPEHIEEYTEAVTGVLPLFKDSIEDDLLICGVICASCFGQYILFRPIYIGELDQSIMQICNKFLVYISSTSLEF
jgi:hypothetical protein